VNKNSLFGIDFLKSISEGDFFMKKAKKLGFLPALGIGVAAAVLLAVALCAPLSLLVTKELVGLEQGGVLAAVASGLAVWAVTMVLSRTRQRQYLATGAALGGCYGFLCALGCALGGSASQFGVWLAWLLGTAVLAGLLGAVMSIGQNPHRKRK
jgi:hypothetical protein